MATTKKSEAEVIDKEAEAIARMEERVPVKLFKDNGRYKDDLTVTVRDKNFVIQRGITVMVPRYVADIIEQSEAQDRKTADMITGLEEEFSRKSKQL